VISEGNVSQTQIFPLFLGDTTDIHLSNSRTLQHWILMRSGVLQAMKNHSGKNQ
jgi:hypothetical protein